MDAATVPAAGHITRIRFFAVAVPVLLLLVMAAVHGYKFPLAPRAHELNRGRTWQHMSRVDGKGVEQVWVPPGCFEMGSDPKTDFHAFANETPRHTVCIGAGFWIDRFEVTNQSFQEFAAAGGFTDRRYWSEEGWRAHEGRRQPYPMVQGYEAPRQPHVKMSWYEAEAYAAWRGGRLPTEAQWEWAARGPDSRLYPWGDQFVDSVANMDRLDLHHTLPVGSYTGGRSWCGAEDMAGNVWEWMADGYDAQAYRHAAETDPFTQPVGPNRVIRGGAWGGTPGGSVGDLRSTRRTDWPADNRKLSHGARVIHADL